MPPDMPARDHDLDFQHAVALQQAGKLAEAAALYRMLLARFPDNPRLLNNLGAVVLRLGDVASSIGLLERTLKIQPEQPLALLNLGIGFQNLNRADQALASFERAIALNPAMPALHLRRAEALQNLERHAEALESADAALALKPGYLEAHLCRGGVLLSLNRFDEALASFERAIVLRPDCVNAHIYRGETLKDLKRFDEALASHERAIALDPESADAHWSKSTLKLLMGDYAQGWQLQEWRWRSRYLEKFRRDFKQPLWLGEAPLAGKTLLIHAEGGLGDVIQKVRYVPMAQELGAKVVLEVPAMLLRLMSSLAGEASVVARGDPLPAFDVHCPTMSLPLAFQTAVTTIPSRIPYLYADGDKARAWRRRLGVKARPRVGLAWSGIARRDIDLNSARKRSIPLRLLVPLLDLPLEFHSLQKHLRADNIAALAGLPQIHQHQDELDDFSDTAALVSEMDLVISIDTSVAHLAGAMGQAAWILLPFASDYRWSIQGPRTAWYPTAILFRQAVRGDWTGVISQITDRLRSPSREIWAQP